MAVAMKKSLIMRALAFCWLALLSCQAQTKREWLRLNSEMPWAAIQLEAPNKLLNQAVVYTELSILGVNTTGSNIPPDTSHIQLHNSDILLDSTETQAAIGRNYEFLLPLIDFAPITLRDAYGPCSALFLWNAKGLSFTSVSSFEFNPPPISLDLEIKVEIADPTFSFNTEQAIPSRATTFFVLTTASNGEDPTIHLDGKPGAPPIKDRFSSISVSYGCNTGSNVVNFILNTYNGTSFSYTLDQTWASNPGNQILVTVVAASSAPSTPDYVIYFAQGSKRNTDISWYWIVLIVLLILLLITLAITAGYLYKIRMQGYEPLDGRSTFQKLRNLLKRQEQPTDQQDSQVQYTTLA